MHPLTVDEIRLILDKIGREVMVPSTEDFPYEIVRSSRSFGFSKDRVISTLQSKLSIMLQVASEREEKG